MLQPRQRDPGPTTAAQQGTQHTSARPHPPDEFIICQTRLLIFDGQLHDRVSLSFDAHAERTQQLSERRHIDEFGDIVECDRSVDRQARCEHWESESLRPTDSGVSTESLTSRTTNISMPMHPLRSRPALCGPRNRCTTA